MCVFRVDEGARLTSKGILGSPVLTKADKPCKRFQNMDFLWSTVKGQIVHRCAIFSVIKNTTGIELHEFLFSEGVLPLLEANIE